MKLFHWSSDRFAGYLDGDIVVIATDVESAREKAKSFYLKHNHFELEDEEGYSYWSDRLETFLKGIEKEPLSDDDEVLIFYGSE